MKLYNTLSKKVEEFIPILDHKVGMYTCGPTVYDLAHVGNFRAMTFYDLLKRTLQFNDYEVKHVMNITDVDDKTIRKSEGDKARFDELTRDYENKFFADLDSLNVIKPDVVTRATEYIDKIVKFIEVLLEKGFAYKGDDGSIYFSIDKFEDYGKLAGLDRKGLKSGARVAQDEYTKENPADFALWKAWDEADGEIFWVTVLGKGRPGWHIECSVMSSDILGETIDIHAGGVDLIFPHHENEIAQSEAKSGQKFVNFWIHNEHLLVDGKKMSKSLGNFYTLQNIIDKGFSPLDFRYFILSAHYRSKLNFTWEGLEAARNAREKLNKIAIELRSTGGQINAEYLDKFRLAVSEDLGTPEAYAITWELLKAENVSNPDKYATLLKFDEILGLNLAEIETEEVPAEIIQIAEKRKSARESKDFAQSDTLRTEMLKKGWQIEDLANNEYKIVK